MPLPLGAAFVVVEPSHDGSGMGKVGSRWPALEPGTGSLYTSKLFPMTEVPMDNQYEAPSVTELGSLSELTLQDKDFTGDDGLTLQGVVIGDSSL